MVQGQLHSTTAGTKLISGRESRRTSAPASEFSAFFVENNDRVYRKGTSHEHQPPRPRANNHVGVPADTLAR